MYTKRLFLFFIIVLFSAAALLAQNVAGVNPLTGAASVVIPLANYQRGSIRFPINLVYNGGGVKPTDVEGSAGISWDVQCNSYAVTRQVRQLPDDIQQDNAGITRTGWMYNTIQSTIGPLTLANTGTPNCTSEATDIATINSDFPNTIDTEPDLFYVNAPGLSCQLIYDQTTAQFHPVEYQDLQISYTTGTNHQINSFTIINDSGTKYVFNVAESTTQSIIGHTPPSYFANTYYQYQNGITYNVSWKLAFIVDINQNAINMIYSNGPVRAGDDSVKLYIGGSATASLQYVVHTVGNQKIDSLIQVAADDDGNFPNETLKFTWGEPLPFGTNKTCIESIIGNNRSISFGYSDVQYTNHSGVTYDRAFLRSVAEGGCGSPLDYSFAYSAETLEEGGFYYSTLLPDSTSTMVDYWGYYTANATPGWQQPSVFAKPGPGGLPTYLIGATLSNSDYVYTLSGSNRMTDTATVAYGSLTQITDLGHGNGTITISNQSNDYYDPSFGNTVKGGGVRVKQLTYYDAVNSANNMVRKYSYVNPTGYSSGKPITLPQYAFSIPYTGSATGATLWADATALSAYDLSTDDHTIMYEYERESTTNAGNTLSQFYVPATNWDATATGDCILCTSPEWHQTIDLQARGACAAYGPAYSNIQAYPFIPSSNYDFERGLPKKVTTYTFNGILSSETDYAYVRTANPSTIPAFKWDDDKNSGVYLRGYNKYSLYYNTRELLATQINKVYDATNHTQPNIDTVNYAYGSTYHKLYTRQAVNSDGNISTQYFSYVKDFTAASGSNPYITALYNLQLQNINWPVETYTKIQNHAGTYYTQAALTLYQPFTPLSTALYRPFRQLSWLQPDGLAFTPLQVDAVHQTISYDSNYFISANFLDYDELGVLQSSDDGNKHEGCRFYDHVTNKTVAVFTNARASEVWFYDFDSEIFSGAGGFSDAGITLVPDRNGKHAGKLVTTGNITFTITKNPNATKYIFSVWFNVATTGGTLTVKLSDGTNIVTRGITLTATSGWQYFELPKFSVTTLGSAITATLTTTATVSLDDILLYPENTEATTYAYDIVQFFKICETNTNGISAYYTYDQWGRMLYARDQDHYILKKTTYVAPSDVQEFNGGVFYQTHQTNTHNDVTNFGTSGLASECTNEGITYTFRFGDGAADSVMTTDPFTSHRYTVPGTYYATLTTRSPLFGVINSIDTVTVTVGPSTNISYTNSVSGLGDIVSITFYRGTTPVGTYTAEEMMNGTAQETKGTYTLKVTMAATSKPYPYPTGGTGGYNGIVITGDGGLNLCGSYSSTNVITYTTCNISSCNNMNINVVNTDPCL